MAAGLVRIAISFVQYGHCQRRRFSGEQDQQGVGGLAVTGCLSRSGTSPLNAEKRDGTFVCAACNQPLFDSTKKYESGTGWPSFWEPLAGGIATKTDFKLIYPRTEYHCSRCGGHQGHVFTDGPQPTGKRYCNNGVALQFVLRGEKLPALRV